MACPYFRGEPVSTEARLRSTIFTQPASAYARLPRLFKLAPCRSAGLVFGAPAEPIYKQSANAQQVERFPDVGCLALCRGQSLADLLLEIEIEPSQHMQRALCGVTAGANREPRIFQFDGRELVADREEMASEADQELRGPG
jgi:hypothetical protein